MLGTSNKEEYRESVRTDIAFVVKGTAFYAPTYDTIKVLKEALIFVGNDGNIARISCKEDDDYREALFQASKVKQVIELGEGQYLLPGFIDTHVHAPQWAQIGKALDRDLPTWLQSYTFPLEAKHSDICYASQRYTHLVSTLLANGTTTAQYFGTVDVESNVQLAQCCKRQGQRAYIGKVVMDDPMTCPLYYRDKGAEAALNDTESFIKRVSTISHDARATIEAVITPRFIPSCTDEVLYGLGDLAKQYDLPIQSHCSEGDWEHTYVRERTGLSDTKAHLKYGLLRNRTTMAHSVFLSEEDALLYREAGANVCHCPVSNVLFAGAIAPIRKRLEEGTLVSLATDISGGYSPSMFDAMRQAILSSRTLESGVDYRIAPDMRGVLDSRIDYKAAFYMATRGGAQSLGIAAGSFEVGMHFDALLFDCFTLHSNITLYAEDTEEDMLQKIVFLGGRPNIQRVWVQGHEVL